MIKAEKMNVKVGNAVKGQVGVVSNYVRFVVRHDEYETKKKAMKDAVAQIAMDHIGVNPLSCSESMVRLSLVDNADKFLKDRAELLAIKDSMDSYGLQWTDFTALSESDKRFITMLAHEIRGNIVLDESILKDVDLKKAVDDYVNNGKIKSAEDKLKVIMNRIFKVGVETAEDGKAKENMFLPIKFESKVTAADVRQFMGFFTGKAVKDKEGNFDWADNSENVQIQLKACTTLAAVLLSRGDYKIVEEKAEGKTEEPKAEVASETETATEAETKEGMGTKGLPSKEKLAKALQKVRDEAV